MKPLLQCQSTHIRTLLLIATVVLGVRCVRQDYFVTDYNYLMYSEAEGKVFADPHCVIGNADSFYIVYPVHYRLEIFDSIISHDPHTIIMDTTVHWHQQVFGPYAFEHVNELEIFVRGRDIRGQEKISGYFSTNPYDTTYQYQLETIGFDSTYYGGFFLSYSGVDSMFQIGDELRKGHKFFKNEKRKMLKYAGQTGANGTIYYDDQIYLPLLMNGEVLDKGKVFSTKMTCNSIERFSKATYDSVFQSVILDTFTLSIPIEDIHLQPIEY